MTVAGQPLEVVRVAHARGRGGSTIAFSEPFDLLTGEQLHALRAVTHALERDIGFSREVPPRIRAVHHHAPEYRALFSSDALLARLSTAAGTPLRLAASARLGCTLNRSGRTNDSPADAWHLDGAAYSLVVLITEPSHFEGGELLVWLADPELLWQARRLGRAPNGRHIRRLAFARAGQAVLLHGCAVPHCVSPIRACSEPRLTLVCGYESDDGTESVPLAQQWRVEALRSAIDAVARRITRRASEGPASALEEVRLTNVLNMLRGAEDAVDA